MKKAKILSLALVVLLIALATVLLVLPAAAEETGAVETEYGTIPAKYADAEAYPFVVFRNGECVVGSNTLYGAFANSEADNSVILLRRDFFLNTPTTEGEYGNLGNARKNTLIDLGNNVLESKSHVFQSYRKSNNETSFTVKNGTFLLTGNKALMRNATWSDGTYLGGYGYDFTFENVTVKFGEDATATSLLVGQDTVHQYDMFLNVTFTDCIFDTTAVTTEGLTLFDATNSLYQVNAVINGCEIKASSAISLMNATGGNENSSLTLAKNGSGEFTTVTLPSSVAFENVTANDGLYVFTEESDNGTNAIYKLNLVPGAVETEYGIIPPDY